MRPWLASLLIFSLNAAEIPDTQQINKCQLSYSSLDDLPCLPLAGLITDELPEVILPSAGPAVTWSNDVYLQADFIYWYVAEEGLGYAYNQAQNALESPVKKGNVHHPQFNMNPGFKVALGIDLNRDKWDFNAMYTWLQANSEKKRSLAPSQLASTLAPTWTSVNQLSPADRLLYASSSFDLHLNVIDLAVGKNFFVSRYLSLRPYVGMKGTWQTQDYHVVYEEEASTLNHMKMSVDQHYFGVGPRCGLQSHLNFTRKWSFFGEIAFSNLWGFFETWQRNWLTSDFESPLAITTLQYKALNSSHDLNAVLETSLGIEFDHWFTCDEFHFSLRAAFECQNWWGQIQLFNPYEPSGHGDLSMAGLTLDFRLDF